MSKNNSNEPAFPVPPDNDYATVSETGLTKREYFASRAQQGLLSSPSGVNAAVLSADRHSISPSVALARAARDHADALIQALGEP